MAVVTVKLGSLLGIRTKTRTASLFGDVVWLEEVLTLFAAKCLKCLLFGNCEGWNLILKNGQNFSTERLGAYLTAR